jgi:hypothetical protein
MRINLVGEGKIDSKSRKDPGAPPKMAAGLLPGSAIRLVAGPPQSLPAGSASNALQCTLQSSLARRESYD